MQRRFSTLMKASGEKSSITSDDLQSEVSTIGKQETVTPLKVKRVDHYYSRWTKGWKYRNTGAKVTIESVPLLKSGDNDPWKDYSFVVVRTVPQKFKPTFKIVIKSEYLLKACKDVIQTWPGILWNSDPLELDPEVFITFLGDFEAYRDAIVAKTPTKGSIDDNVLATVNLLLNAIHSDYTKTIRSIRRLQSHNEIIYDLLYAILVPRSIIVTRCAITGAPRLFKLVEITRGPIDGSKCYQLKCHSMDLVDRELMQSVGVATVTTHILIKHFKGTVPIDSLDAYPIRFHQDAPKLKETIKARGKKWVELKGVHHKEFSGIAASRSPTGTLSRHRVQGRIMVDRASFRQFNPDNQYPTAADSLHNEQELDEYGNPISTVVTPDGVLVQSDSAGNDTPEDVELTDEELILTPTVVHGFSFSNKLWLEFDVEKITEVDWNDVFANLVIYL